MVAKSKGKKRTATKTKSVKNTKPVVKKRVTKAVKKDENAAILQVVKNEVHDLETSLQMQEQLQVALERVEKIHNKNIEKSGGFLNKALQFFGNVASAIIPSAKNREQNIADFFEAQKIAIAAVNKEGSEIISGFEIIKTNSAENSVEIQAIFAEIYEILADLGFETDVKKDESGTAYIFAPAIKCENILAITESKLREAYQALRKQKEIENEAAKKEAIERKKAEEEVMKINEARTKAQESERRELEKRHQILVIERREVESRVKAREDAKRSDRASYILISAVGAGSAEDLTQLCQNSHDSFLHKGDVIISKIPSRVILNSEEQHFSKVETQDVAAASLR